MMGMGIGRVMMVCSPMGVGWRIALAGTRAFPLAELAALHGTLHMVVVAVLGAAHLPLKAQHLGPVFAEGTIHGICALQDFQEAILKRAENLRMVP
jgi:hypothetical protein